MLFFRLSYLDHLFFYREIDEEKVVVSLMFICSYSQNNVPCISRATNAHAKDLECRTVNCKISISRSSFQMKHEQMCLDKHSDFGLCIISIKTCANYTCCHIVWILFQSLSSKDLASGSLGPKGPKLDMNLV